MAGERLNLRLDPTTGNLFLDIPNSIPPRHILDLLQSRFGATIVSRHEDPLGDWIDLRLSISGQELTLTSAYYGAELWTTPGPAIDLLRTLAPQLAAALGQDPPNCQPLSIS
jgi:hypothetical protein